MNIYIKSTFKTIKTKINNFKLIKRFLFLINVKFKHAFYLVRIISNIPQEDIIEINYDFKITNDIILSV